MEIIPFDSSSLYYNSFATPFGSCLIACCENGISSFLFTENEESGYQQLLQNFPKVNLLKKEHALHHRALESFHSGEAQDLPLSVQGTPFQMQVWRALMSIPRGQTRHYKEIAESIGQLNASRAVGTAIGKNPVAVLIPCHRVVPVSGGVGNYRWGVELKRAFLNWEQSGILPVNG